MAPFKARSASEHFAFQHINNAQELVSAIAKARAEEGATSRQTNERFYNNLALFSGGTIALSVTYLGYLKTVPKIIQHPRWLVASWTASILCVACSLFWTFIYGHYSHLLSVARIRGSHERAI
jgi:hypothetical protein